MTRLKYIVLIGSFVVLLHASGSCESSNTVPACQSTTTLLTNIETIYQAQYPNVNAGPFTTGAFWLQQEISAGINDARKSEPANKASAAEKRTDQQTTAPSG